MNADATLDQLRVERDALDALVETAETIEKALQAWATEVLTANLTEAIRTARANLDAGADPAKYTYSVGDDVWLSNDGELEAWGLVGSFAEVFLFESDLTPA